MLAWHPAHTDGGNCFHGLVRGPRQQSEWFWTEKFSGIRSTGGACTAVALAMTSQPPQQPPHQCARGPGKRKWK